MCSETSPQVKVRLGELTDLPQLLTLESLSFKYDRISQRSFKRFLQSETASLLVLETSHGVQGYGLVLYQNGTSLARIYSLAVHPQALGQGFGQTILQALEDLAQARDKLFIRLEVEQKNAVALHVYTKNGYTTTAEILDYYAEGVHATRMEKRLVRAVSRPKHCPYVQQSTDFTCGPAALLMAMKSINKTLKTSVIEELDLWRESTTIFMASGHGGTSPHGLALAAHRRGFNPVLWIHGEAIPFIQSMRTPHKKEIYETVHKEFERQCRKAKIEQKNQPISIEALSSIYKIGHTAIVLISTYQLNREKVPHWVWIVKIDDRSVYINDPFIDIDGHVDDNIFIPVPKEIFKKMLKYGGKKLSSAIVLHKSILKK